MIASYSYRNVTGQDGRVRRNDLGESKFTNNGGNTTQLTIPTLGKGNSSKKQVVSIGRSPSWPHDRIMV
jgi:hypothetical protein